MILSNGRSPGLRRLPPRRHPERPAARTWRVELAALDYAKALEAEGTAVVVLHRDEDPSLHEPDGWREVYRTGG